MRRRDTDDSSSEKVSPLLALHQRVGGIYQKNQRGKTRREGKGKGKKERSHDAGKERKGLRTLLKAVGLLSQNICHDHLEGGSDSREKRWEGRRRQSLEAGNSFYGTSPFHPTMQVKN